MLLVFVTGDDDGIYYVKVVLIKHNPASYSFGVAVYDHLLLTPQIQQFSII